MTVIAFDGCMVAADTLMTVAGIRMVPHYEKVKLKRYQEGSVLYAQTGAAGWLDAWIAWDEDGADPANTPPSKIPAHESGQILKWDEGILYRLIPEHPYWLTLGSTLDAFGSGADVAIGAMEAGADAFTAAAIALRRVSGCGGTVLAWYARHPDPETVWRPLERCACRKCNDWFMANTLTWSGVQNVTDWTPDPSVGHANMHAHLGMVDEAVSRHLEAQAQRASHRYDPDTGTLERISYPAHAETACPCASCDPPFSTEPVLRSSAHHPRCNVWSHNVGTECDCRNRHCDCLDQVRHHDGCKWHLTVYDIKEQASPKCHHNMHGTVSNSGTGEVRCANCNERMCACPDEATPFVYHWSNCASLNAENQDCDCGAKTPKA
jgi:hypothetical protein